MNELDKVQKYIFQKSVIKEVIENQIKLNTYSSLNLNLDSHLSTENLIRKYNKLIRLQCSECKNEITGLYISNIKQKLADIFILGLEFSLHMKQEKEIYRLLESDFVRVYENDEVDCKIMVERLACISSKFADTFKDRFGLFTIKGILDIVVLYGCRDFLGVVEEIQCERMREYEVI